MLSPSPCRIGSRNATRRDRRIWRLLIHRGSPELSENEDRGDLLLTPFAGPTRSPKQKKSVIPQPLDLLQPPQFRAAIDLFLLPKSSLSTILPSYVLIRYRVFINTRSKQCTNTFQHTANPQPDQALSTIVDRYYQTKNITIPVLASRVPS
ncbi:hypothetical protein RU639_004624 [Aspergillus parasiticus]